MRPTTRRALDNRAPTRRYLQPDFRCLCCKRRSSRASARTRYLQRCLRRTGTDVTHVTCVYPLLAAALYVSRLIRTVRRRHVTAAEPLVTGTFSMGTSDNRRSGRLLTVDSLPVWPSITEHSAGRRVGGTGIADLLRGVRRTRARGRSEPHLAPLYVKEEPSGRRTASCARRTCPILGMGRSVWIRKMCSVTGV
jgi:hypothetical protein